MCDSSSNAREPCNRKPFLSDENCDRGNVDLRQFEDLPFCEKVDPTYPEVPPEIVDSPISMPLPTYSCSCIDVSVDTKIGWSKNRKFKGEATFKADGDCCDGNYKSDISLEIPCPIVKAKPTDKVSVSIKYGNGANSLARDVVNMDDKKCTVSPRLARFDLNIRCPVLGFDGKHKLTATARYAREFNVASAEFMRTDNKECAIEPLSPALNLDIKCPLGGASENFIKAKIGYGSAFNSVSAKIMDADLDQCALRPASPTLNLNIPCPIIDQQAPDGCRVGLGPGITVELSRKKIAVCLVPNKGYDVWEMRRKDNNNLLAVFKSISGWRLWRLDERATGVEFYDRGKHITRPATRTDIVVGDCEPRHGVINCTDTYTLPPGAVGFQAKFIDVDSASSSSSSSEADGGNIVEIFKTDADACTIEPLAAKVGTISIPCPVRREDKSQNPKLKIGLEYGSDFNSTSASIVSIGSSCDMTFPKETNMSLKIPCPLHSLNITAETVDPSSSTPIGLYIESLGDSSGEDSSTTGCSKNIKLKFAFPDLDIGGGGLLPCNKYIVAKLRWNYGGNHKIEVGYAPMCDPENVHHWEELLTAAAHTGEC